MSDGCTSSSQSVDPGEQPTSTGLTIGIVGVCGSGKSTLAAGLQRRGYAARQIGQEHSYVPDLWRRRTSPDILVFLDASDRTVERRLGPLLYSALLTVQRRRLMHAREHAHIQVATDPLTPDQVLEAVVARLIALRRASSQLVSRHGDCPG